MEFFFFFMGHVNQPQQPLPSPPGLTFARWSMSSRADSVTQAPDQTDVVAAFVKSARAGGLGVGFYYSDATNSYCRVSGGVVRPGAVTPGRQIAVTQEQYDDIVLAHLAELWGNYVRARRALQA